jgi:hypothetical protein
MIEATESINQRINDLLAQWHAWSASASTATGYPTVNCTCRLARASRQYDDQNGGLDAHVDNVLMEAVDSVVESIEQPYRLALHMMARNLHTRSSVWTSPRLPADPAERAAMIARARALFMKALDRRSLLV